MPGPLATALQLQSRQRVYNQSIHLPRSIPLQQGSAPTEAFSYFNYLYHWHSYHLPVTSWAIYSHVHSSKKLDLALSYSSSLTPYPQISQMLEGSNSPMMSSGEPSKSKGPSYSPWMAINKPKESTNPEPSRIVSDIVDNTAPKASSVGILASNPRIQAAQSEWERKLEGTFVSAIRV